MIGLERHAEFPVWSWPQLVAAVMVLVLLLVAVHLWMWAVRVRCERVGFDWLTIKPVDSVDGEGGAR